METLGIYIGGPTLHYDHKILFIKSLLYLYKRPFTVWHWLFHTKILEDTVNGW